MSGLMSRLSQIEPDENDRNIIERPTENKKEDEGLLQQAKAILEMLLGGLIMLSVIFVLFWLMLFLG